MLNEYEQKKNDVISILVSREITVKEAMELLGRIRARFQSLPGPNGQISQDGAELKTQAKEMKEELTKELQFFVPGGDIVNPIYLG